jgi:acetyl esterase/lipase
MHPTLLTLVALWGVSSASATSPRVADAAARWEAVAAGQSDTGAVTVEANVPYASVNGSELHLDVYEPAGTDTMMHPAVMLIHGGGWSSLDKSTMRTMGNFLARFGFVAFAVDYRLVQGSDNKWPAQLDDVQRAVRWVRAHAAKYHVNPDHVGAFGHSAGAQLAALLGMTDTRDNGDAELAKYSSRVQAVVDVSGPTDFTTHTDPDDLAFLANFLGAELGTHPEVWRDASPAYHAAKTDAPFLVVQGTQDNEVPMAQAQELVDKLQAAGVPVTFIKVDDGHTFRKPEARRQLAVETLAFFNRYLEGP